MAEWLKIKCGSCRGYGVVSDFRGDDFNGAMDCSECGGAGHQWISENDRVADYPGGPLRGSWPGGFKLEQERLDATP